MTEFSELVRIKKRICIKYKSSGCFGCPINCSIGNLCGIISTYGYSDNKFMEFEEALLSWAAEHPEPVYPSIAKYLEQFGIIIRRDGTLQADFFKANAPMSADLAQKLGIEPKEG